MRHDEEYVVEPTERKASNIAGGLVIYTEGIDSYKCRSSLVHRGESTEQNGPQTVRACVCVCVCVPCASTVETHVAVSQLICGAKDTNVTLVGANQSSNPAHTVVIKLEMKLD